MKKMVFLGFVGMILPMISHGNPIEEAEVHKIYVEPSQLSFTTHEMFAYLDGGWALVSAIHADSLGLYIAVANYPYTRWICRAPGCGYNNYVGDTTCQKRNEITGRLCGSPRPQG